MIQIYLLSLCTLKDKKGHLGSQSSFTVHVKVKSTAMTPARIKLAFPL